MKIRLRPLAVIATALTFAGGTGTAWACGADSGSANGTTGTTPTQATTTPTGASATQTASSGTSSTSAPSAPAGHSKRHHSSRHGRQG